MKLSTQNTERFISCNWSHWRPLMKWLSWLTSCWRWCGGVFLNKIWSVFKQDWNWTKRSLKQDFESRLQPVRLQPHNYICFNITSTFVCRIKVKRNKMFCVRSESQTCLLCFRVAVVVSELSFIDGVDWTNYNETFLNTNCSLLRVKLWSRVLMPVSNDGFKIKHQVCAAACRFQYSF